MNDNTLIKIDKLICSYSLEPSDKVLSIDHLEIEKGEIIFLLGSSGSGKSTLLETLGLMNNTIASGHILWNDTQSQYDFAELWQKGHQEKINDLRKEKLSFIFQNTNLMDNFTAYENICLSQMIKGGEKKSQIIENAKKLMNQIGLPSSVVNYNTVAVNLSGGQRQRVSFVRALNNQFSVLLCDEPTGNLDEVNASELMLMIKQNIGTNRTAIIVSHDVNLALRFADRIVLLTQNAGGYGEILKEHIYDSNHWLTMTASDQQKFKNSLISKFVSEKKSGQEVKESINPDKNDSYRQLFLKKESVVLYGARNINWLFLVSILVLTFIAVGFSNGALEYLNKKRNDAFINWLAVMIPASKGESERVQEFVTSLNEKTVKQKYNIKSVTSYKEYSLPIYAFDKSNNTPTDEVKYIKGRLLMDEIDGHPDPIKTDIFGSKNFLQGNKDFKNQEDIGIVVTKQLLNYLNYPENTCVIYIDNNEQDLDINPNKKFKAPVPIRAIIQDLPNKNKFISTETFYKAYIAPTDNRFDFSGDNRKKILYFVEGDNKLVEQAKIQIEKILTEKERNDISISIDTCEYFYQSGYLLSVELNEIPENYTITDALDSKIKTISFFKENKNQITRILNYALFNSEGKIYKYDYLSINFGSLDHVEDFANYFSSELNSGDEGEQSNVIELDTAKVKDKKNFLYLMNITLIITFLLIVFAVLSISLFISNLLRNHLNKIKMNLGTYKAFGLSNKEATKIYLTIMLRFIFSGIFSALLLSWILGIIINSFFKARFNLEELTNYFILIDISTGLLLLLIIAITVLVSYFNINKTLSKTPGDLIYNR